jgi:hypothetical protein
MVSTRKKPDSLSADEQRQSADVRAEAVARAIAKRDAGLDLTPREVAMAYGRRVQKVLEWINTGELDADDVSEDLSKKPRWRIRSTVLEAFFERRRQARRKARRPVPRRQAEKKDSLIDPATGKVRESLRDPGSFGKKR